MRVLVTGGAGFIGSHIVDALLAQGHEVTAADNLSGGKKEFIANHLPNPRFTFISGDLSDPAFAMSAMKGQEFVWHLAAKPNVRTYTAEDFRNDVACTQNVLEAAKQSGAKGIVFSSSSTVYGEAKIIPTPENVPQCPISLYGASKAACEALISAYSASFGINAWIFRFANIIGERGTHGVIVDFIDKLRRNPAELEILGDGRQSKSYLLVQDCITGMMEAIKKSGERFNVFNVGCSDWVSVKRIAEIVSEEMEIKPVFRFTGGERGWVGDVPKMQLSTEKIGALGWKPNHDSESAVRAAVNALLSA